MSCNLCTLGKGTQLTGRGNPKADLMIVLDCPTMGCSKQKKFLSGDILQKVKYLLDRVNIPFSSVYITSAVKCPVATPSTIKTKQVDTCRDYLIDEIIDVKPKLIIPMGKYALHAVTNDSSVKEFRGHFDLLELDYVTKLGGKVINQTLKIDVLPTFSPIGSMTKWENDIYIIHDLLKGKKFLKDGIIHLTELPEYKVALDKKSLLQMRKEILESKAVVIDFETTGLSFHSDEIINAGYCTNDNKIWITYMSGFPVTAYAKFTPEEIERADIINKFVIEHQTLINEVLRDINGSKNVKKIGHNLKFDGKFALKHKIPIKNWYFDTIIADALEDENRFHDLNSAMEIRGINFGPYDTKLWKYVNKDHKKKKPYNNVPPQLLEKYLAIDVYGCWKLYKKEIKWLKTEPKIYKYMFNQQMPLAKELLRMEYLGHKVDKDDLLEAHDKLNKESEMLLTKIKKFVKNDDFNPNSPAQVSAYMTEKDYPFEKFEVKKGANGYSTGAAVLEKFCTIKKWRKLPELILRLRKVNKYNSTFVYGPVTKTRKVATGLVPLLDANGFIHTSYNIHTPRTGRLSSQSPNFQNLPRDDDSMPSIRQCFKPDNKKMLSWEADYISLEVVVSAWLSGDKLLIKLLKEGKDMHSYNLINVGSKIGMIDKSVSYDKFKEVLKYDGKDKELLELKKEYSYLRFLTKSVIFGLNYGQEARTFAKDLERPLEEMEDFIDEYFDLYHGVYKFREKVKNIALTKGILVLKSGRKRRFTYATDWINSPFGEKCSFKTGMLRSEIERQALNFPVQGEANDLYVKGKLKLIKELRKNKIKGGVRLTIHDGFVAVGYEKDLPVIEKMCHELMTTIVKLKDGSELSIGVDFDAKTHWYGDVVKFKSLM